MTPAEFKAARLSLGLTQPQAADCLGYGAPNRISEIENGKGSPGAAVILLLRAYMDGYRPADWPDVSCWQCGQWLLAWRKGERL